MNREQFRAFLDKFKLTQSGFADLIGVSSVTGRRWAVRGIAQMPTVILVRLLIRNKITIKDIVEARIHK